MEQNFQFPSPFSSPDPVTRSKALVLRPLLDKLLLNLFVPWWTHWGCLPRMAAECEENVTIFFLLEKGLFGENFFFTYSPIKNQKTGSSSSGGRVGGVNRSLRVDKAGSVHSSSSQKRDFREDKAMAGIILQLIAMAIFLLPSGTILPHLKCLWEKLKWATCAFPHKGALYLT